jgi:hypothetical protein
MKYFVILLFALSLEATAANQGADRTITWNRGKSGPNSGYGSATVISDTSGGSITWVSSCTGPALKKSKDLDDLSGHGSGAGCCDRSRKTLRHSQSHQLDHDCTYRPLELDYGGGAVDEPPLASGLVLVQFSNNVCI